MTTYERFQIVVTAATVAGLIFWQTQKHLTGFMGPIERKIAAAFITIFAMLGLSVVTIVGFLLAYWVVYGTLN